MFHLKGAENHLADSTGVVTGSVSLYFIQYNIVGATVLTINPVCRTMAQEPFHESPLTETLNWLSLALESSPGAIYTN